MILSLDCADTVAIDRAVRHGNQTALVWLENLREPYRDRRWCVSLKYPPSQGGIRSRGIAEVHPMPGLHGLSVSRDYRSGVTIGEDANVVRLSHADWNELVRLIKSGELREV